MWGISGLTEGRLYSEEEFSSVELAGWLVILLVYTCNSVPSVLSLRGSGSSTVSSQVHTFGHYSIFSSA